MLQLIVGDLTTKLKWRRLLKRALLVCKIRTPSAWMPCLPSSGRRSPAAVLFGRHEHHEILFFHKMKLNNNEILLPNWQDVFRRTLKFIIYSPYVYMLPDK
jgi:hypothetical protein